jgi:hypothetical protein
VQGTTTLTVTAPLVSIAVTPANPSIPVGLTQQFTATGTRGISPARQRGVHRPRVWPRSTWEAWRAG